MKKLETNKKVFYQANDFIKKKKKVLHRQLIQAHNYKTKNNLIPETIAKLNHHQLSFHMKFTFLCISENQNLIDIFLTFLWFFSEFIGATHSTRQKSGSNI